MNRSSLTQSALPFFIRLTDVLLIWLAGVLALEMRRVYGVPVFVAADLSGYYSLIVGGGLLFLIFSRGVYKSWRGRAIPSMLATVTANWLFVLGGLLLWLFLIKTTEDFSRLWFLMWGLTSLLLMWLERVVVYFILRILRKRGFNLKRIALIGEGATANRILERLEGSGWTGYSLFQYVSEPKDEDLEHIASKSLDEIWLAMPLGNEDSLRAVLHGLRHTSASIRFAPDWFTYRFINHGVSEILDIPMLDISASPISGVNNLIKMIEDRILSSLILILISPLMILIALGVKLNSPGPILYRQERIGLNSRPFQMLKFRSMPVDTDAKGLSWGGANEKATSAFGRFIRKTSLDELPQFLNVLYGDMSIVGPRPERPQFVEAFKDQIPGYMKKHLVKAGITGWAQVHGWRGDTDLEQRIEHDLYYIEHWSLWLDLKIIALTVIKVLGDSNAR